MTEYGVDVSHWNITDARWWRNDVAGGGFSFCYIKITEGSRFWDLMAERNVNDALVAGLITGVYHVVTRDNPVAQALHIVETGKSIGAHTLPLILDWESRLVSKDVVRALVGKLREYSRPPRLLYVPRWFTEQMHVPSVADLGLPTIASRYVGGGADYASVMYQRTTAEYWGSYAGVTPSMLQFTDRAKVGARVVDVNAYEGHLDDLKVLMQGYSLSDSVTSVERTYL